MVAADCAARASKAIFATAAAVAATEASTAIVTAAGVFIN